MPMALRCCQAIPAQLGVWEILIFQLLIGTFSTTAEMIDRKTIYVLIHYIPRHTCLERLLLDHTLMYSRLVTTDNISRLTHQPKYPPLVQTFHQSHLPLR